MSRDVQILAGGGIGPSFGFLAAIALASCAAPAPLAGREALRVASPGQAFGFDEGAAARKQGEAVCAGQGRGLRTSIYDRYEGGTWVFPEGCA